MANTSFVNAPSQTVKKKFTVSGATSAPAAESPLPAMPAGSPLTPESLPGTITQEQIGEMFAPLLQEAAAQQAPLSRPVPAELSPLGTFLGTLAGNLASTFSQNPAFAQQSQRFLAEDAARRQAIEEQNYAQTLLFDKEKRNRLISLRGQILEAQVGRAIETGDLERAEVATRNLAKFQEGLRREAEKVEQAGKERLLRIEGEEARKTQAQRFRLEIEEGRNAKTKPLTSREYVTSINDINKNKNIKDRGFWEGIGAEFRKLIGQVPEPTDRETALETVYVTGLLGGEPQVRPTAWRSLRLSIRRRLRLPETGTLNPLERQKFETELSRYGLELGGLEP